MASSIPTQIKSGEHAPEPDTSERFDDRVSQTSFASSMSGTDKLRPPPLPQDGHDGKPFECIMCRYMVNIDHDIAWQKHVYNDLQPYVRLQHRNSTIADLLPRFAPLSIAPTLIAHTNPEENGGIMSCRSIVDSGAALKDVTNCSHRERRSECI